MTEESRITGESVPKLSLLIEKGRLELERPLGPWWREVGTLLVGVVVF